jgi:hypothetical protein
LGRNRIGFYERNKLCWKKLYQLWRQCDGDTAFAERLIGGALDYRIKMGNLAVGAGIGTSGLVGQIAAITAMASPPMVWIAILLLHFILPTLLLLLFAQLL